MNGYCPNCKLPLSEHELKELLSCYEKQTGDYPMLEQNALDAIITSKGHRISRGAGRWSIDRQPWASTFDPIRDTLIWILDNLFVLPAVESPHRNALDDMPDVVEQTDLGEQPVLTIHEDEEEKPVKKGKPKWTQNSDND